LRIGPAGRPEAKCAAILAVFLGIIVIVCPFLDVIDAGLSEIFLTVITGTDLAVGFGILNSSMKQ
jgi:hypothetical protein